MGLGVTFASLGALGVQSIPRVAVEAQELGFDSFWVAEANGPEAFASLAAAGAAAPGLSLGTGVIALQLRTPPLAAMAAATLQALHPDRDIYLGVGISSPVVAGKWHGATYGSRPLAQVREYLTLLRACLSGETVSVRGEFWSIDKFRLGVRLGERRPKIVLAALNQGMLRLGGELADAVLLNYLPASAVPWCVEHIRAGGQAEVMAYVHAGVCNWHDGIEAARRDLYSYAVVPAYAAAFERAGFETEIAGLRRAQQAGDREAAVASMSDEMVMAIDTMGDADHVRAFVRSYRSAGVTTPVLMPLPWGPDRVAITRATMEAVASEA
jgi:probable F420-dependent oxidoreductase